MRQNLSVLLIILISASFSLGLVFKTILFVPKPESNVISGLNQQVLSDTTAPTPTTTSCQQPSGGCGSNYYFNTSSCTCEPAAGTCVPPYNGCPTNYTFNSSTCQCVASTSCNMPSSGCGPNQYWDSALCQCRSYTSGSSSCPSPTAGCGSNYYWDSGTCSCLQSSGSGGSGSGGGGSGGYASSICPSPTYGCGSNYFWDSGSCSCKPYTNTTTTTSTCQVPSAGCATNYYWDSSSCSCKQYQTTTSGCYPPGSGCGTDKYWDSYSCQCKSSDSSCYPPSAGCAVNTYWNYNTCECAQSPQTQNICYPSSSGCGSNQYWDYYFCACKSSSDYQTYATSYYSSYSQVLNYDRLAYEPQDRISCVKSQLTAYEFERLRYLIPINSEQKLEIENIGKKAEACWQNKIAVQSSVTSGGQTQYVAPLEGEKCLINSIGEANYRDITQGKRTPTYDEHLKFDKCYGSVNPDTIVYQTSDAKIPKVINDCVKGVLGNSSYQKIIKGEMNVPTDLRDKVDRCFGADPQPFNEGKTYRIPTEVKNCLLDKVGEKRFSEISAGGVPSAQEKKDSESCFANIHKDQVKFLPVPVEQAPFLEEANDIVSFGNIKQETKVSKEKTLGGKISLAGTGPKNSEIIIYIYSEPIVVTTKTDENGEWLYELDQPLSGEKHIAYASVKSSSGKIVRSSVFDFTVVAAEDELANRFIDESTVNATSRNKFINIAFILMTIAFIIVILIYTYYYLRKTNQQSGKPLQNDSEQEGDQTKPTQT